MERKWGIFNEHLGSIYCAIKNFTQDTIVSKSYIYFKYLHLRSVRMFKVPNIMWNYL